MTTFLSKIKKVDISQWYIVVLCLTGMITFSQYNGGAFFSYSPEEWVTL
ncbi:Uncharacterised protein [Mycobacterium tuberculosis]|nr:Uncharacterised protein [Mycobacterium tuberculosis]